MKKSVVRPFFALILISAFSATLSAQPAGSPVATHGQLKVSGSQLVDKNNNPVQLRGMSLYWSMGPGGRDFYNANVVKWLRDDWKASVVRAAMGVEANWGGGQQGITAGDNSGGVSNKKRVTDVVDGAIANGMYVIIDWHSHEAEKYTNQAKSFFEEMARAYGSNPNIIYEIYNEPLGVGKPDSTWQAIKPYMQTITSAIRDIDANNPIIIGTPGWCQRPDVAAGDPVVGENLLYSLHFYAGTAAHRGALRENAYQTMKKGKAVFISEFGTCNSDGGGAHNAAETDIWMSFMDQFKLSWANWSLGTTNEAASALKSGSSTSGNWNSGNLTASGTYIRDKLKANPVTEKAFYTLTVNVVGQGSVTRSPTTDVVQKGANVMLIASASRGWTFQGWSGDLSGSESSPRFTMDGDKEVTATFIQSTSALPPNARGGVARWSVRRVGGAFSLIGPPDGLTAVSLYDTRGKVVRSFPVNPGLNGQMTVSNIKLPSGSYVLVVKNRSTGREMYKTRVSLVD